jgi:uncharacterized protein YrzB (UPF0473 family)
MSEENKVCDCGCDHDHHDHETEDFAEDLVVLEDEDGNEIAFHYITTLEHDGKSYVYLQPSEEAEEDFLEIYELEEGGEGAEGYDNLLPVDDDMYELLYAKLMHEIEEDGGCDCEDENCEHCHK